MQVRLVEADGAATGRGGSRTGATGTGTGTRAPRRTGTGTARPRPAGPLDRLTLLWTECGTYEEAKDHRGILYLHEWDGRPFYWGIARTRFGNRYNAGYRHWIEGCLRHGARLYVARIVSGNEGRLQEVENYLIREHGHEANRIEKPIVQALELRHEGAVPASVRRPVGRRSDRAA